MLERNYAAEFTARTNLRNSNMEVAELTMYWGLKEGTNVIEGKTHIKMTPSSEVFIQGSKVEVKKDDKWIYSGEMSGLDLGEGIVGTLKRICKEFGISYFRKLYRDEDPSSKTYGRLTPTPPRAHKAENRIYDYDRFLQLENSGQNDLAALFQAM